MAAGYGAAALDKLSHAEWFQGALSSLKTVAKSEEAIVNAYPAIRKLFV
jgi:indole-3-glycerol phosphate synthase